MSVPPYELGYICSPADYERSLHDDSLRCLTRGDSFGLLIVVEASLLSLMALVFVFALIMHKIIWRVKHLTSQRLQVFHQPMDLLMLSLFFADTIQAIGGIQNIKWIRDGKTVEGSYCSSQGIIKNIGEIGVAFSTLAIAAFTMAGIFLKSGISSMKITLVVLLVTWALILLIVAVPNIENHDNKFQAPVPYWCWIGKNYYYWKLFAEYLWLWIALGLSCLTYIPLWLWMRGNIVLDERMRWKWSFRSVREADPAIVSRRRRSLTMLLYPIVYFIIVLPLSVIRWPGFEQERKYNVDPTPSRNDFAALATFGLSGFLNVILLLTTRPHSGLFGTLMFTSEARPPFDLPLVQEQGSRQEDSDAGGEGHGDLGRVA